jgi:hypothetical protein
MGAGLLEHLDTGHLRHSLVGGDQRDRLVPQREFRQHRKGLCARVRAHDEVVVAVPVSQIAGDRGGHHGIVVDGQDRRFAHLASPQGSG